MIPEFPQFKKVELTDVKDVNKFTSKFSSYSDFSFVSMWSWDIKGEMLICRLNDNLVVRFTDYITGAPFYSFLGENKVNETAKTLLDLSLREGIKPELKLIPQEILKELDQKLFCAEEDRDHFDYIYSIQELKDMTGGKFSKKRNQVSLFLKNYPEAEGIVMDLTDKNTQGEIMNLFLEWLNMKIAKEEIYESHEEVAVGRLLLAVDTCHLVGIGVYVNKKLIGFFINELKEGEWVVAHALKTNRSFSGVNTFLMKKNAEILFNHKKSVFNYEQDLGMANLRDAKTRFRPVKFLKKYKLTAREIKML
jgi:hypothetical protein